MWWEYYSNTGNDERIEDTRINTCTLMSGCLNEWMDELKRERIDQGEGEEDEGEDADEDEVAGRRNRREEENRTTLPEAEEAAEEECIEIREAKYRLRIHGLTTEQYRTVQNST